MPFSVDPDRLFTPSQAAKELGVPCPTIYSWIRRGVLRSYHPRGSNRLFILKTDVRKLKGRIILHPNPHPNLAGGGKGKGERKGERKSDLSNYP